MKHAKEAEGTHPTTVAPEASKPPAESAQSSRASGEAGPNIETAQTSLEEQINALKAQVSDKEREVAELRDKYLRALAEQENARKRLRHQSEENLRLQRESLLRELLLIVDNLENAVAAARGGGNGKPIVEGVELVLRSVQEFLRKHGVTPHEAVGRPFDPQFHEAVDETESREHRPNTVIQEFNRGYQIGDRVLRPARVSVAKAPAGASGEAKSAREDGGAGPNRGENKGGDDVEND